jgi:uncharacterized membrane protein YedE/YeeE
MLEFVKQPWHWSIAGLFIGLTVPVLLIIGNKNFGISSSLRHLCAACIPANIPLFKYNWKNEMWNLFFVVGVLLGGFMGTFWLGNDADIQIAQSTIDDLRVLGVSDFSSLMPVDIFSFENLFTLKGLFFFVIGGFLVGFGTRYAGGCTSGHSIMGLASLQWPSLVATIFFMLGGFAMTHFGLPLIFNLINK